MEEKKEINKTQIIVLAIAIPIVLLAIAIGIAGSYASKVSYPDWEPFNFEDTWWIWLFYVVIISVIEFLLFRTKEDKKE